MDSDAAMREMMGFSNFKTSGKKAAGKNKDKDPATSNNTTPIQSKFTEEDLVDRPPHQKRNDQARNNTPNIPYSLTPASLPPPSLPPKPPPTVLAADPLSSSRIPTSTTTMPHATFLTSIQEDGDQQATSNSNSNSHARSNTYTNLHGDTIYFKTSFIDPDPWRYAREAKALKEAKGRIKARHYGSNEVNGVATGSRGKEELVVVVVRVAEVEEEVEEEAVGPGYKDEENEKDTHTTEPRTAIKSQDHEQPLRFGPRSNKESRVR